MEGHVGNGYRSQKQQSNALDRLNQLNHWLYEFIQVNQTIELAEAKRIINSVTGCRANLKKGAYFCGRMICPACSEVKLGQKQDQLRQAQRKYFDNPKSFVTLNFANTEESFDSQALKFFKALAGLARSGFWKKQSRHILARITAVECVAFGGRLNIHSHVVLVHSEQMTRKGRKGFKADLETDLRAAWGDQLTKYGLEPSPNGVRVEQWLDHGSFSYVAKGFFAKPKKGQSIAAFMVEAVARNDTRAKLLFCEFVRGVHGRHLLTYAGEARPKR